FPLFAWHIICCRQGIVVADHTVSEGGGVVPRDPGRTRSKRVQSRWRDALLLGLLAAMALPGSASADDVQTIAFADQYLVTRHAVALSDGALATIRGRGAVAPEIDPTGEEFGVILWDEHRGRGGGRPEGAYVHSLGSGNVQNMSITINGARPGRRVLTHR